MTRPSPSRATLIRRASLTVALLLAPAAALALDWAGKLQQDVAELRSPNAEVRLQALRRIAQYPPAQSRPHILASTIRALLTMRQSALAAGKTLTLWNCTEKIREIFSVGGFDQIFEMR